MEKIKKRFGFGCMRLPKQEEEIDHAHMKRMVDAFLENGFNYFDTAHGYHSGRSELALRECLTSRYPREDYVLTNKLSAAYIKEEADVLPFFESQLQLCGVEYFDFYLVHAVDRNNYEKFKACRAFEQVTELKKQGKVRHIGLSFHDKPHILDEILTAYPQLEVVQIQLNYLDYEDPCIEAKGVLEICRKHKKPVIVMEPVKGGCLANLPEEAKAELDALQGGSPATYALRWCLEFPDVFMVLSGMGNMDMMAENLTATKDPQPLDETEAAAIARVTELLRKSEVVACTACRYCQEGCPMGIPIADVFACWNKKHSVQAGNARYYYRVFTKHGGKAESCIGCGACESICPQHLPIPALLKEISEVFDV